MKIVLISQLWQTTVHFHIWRPISEAAECGIKTNGMRMRSRELLLLSTFFSMSFHLSPHSFRLAVGVDLSFSSTGKLLAFPTVGKKRDLLINFYPRVFRKKHKFYIPIRSKLFCFSSNLPLSFHLIKMHVSSVNRLA